MSHLLIGKCKGYKIKWMVKKLELISKDSVMVGPFECLVLKGPGSSVIQKQPFGGVPQINCS